ncbi:MAG: XdhC family protein [Gammaproteobacteria bacterium]|nr:XdhC family protein [Gammaproteobacteria bacterium]MDH3428934.1 XdhC family protein [Gammaproteobacteria bacterium]
MNPDLLLQFFDSRRERGESLVLVTVYETQGSTYSKAGAQMLVDQDGVFRGMLSGGCLEGDLSIRAQQVLQTATPQTVTYDLGVDDELWGMGVGCDGLMRMYLQPLCPEDGYAPFTQIADILRGHTAADVSIPLAAESPDTLTVRVEPPPQVLVLGAGLDAEPVVRFAAELGWRCTVFDHRQAYIDNGDFSQAEATCCAPADELADRLELARFRMAIVMSHHLASDRAYLRQLSETDMAYIGLLGPRNRRDRLLVEIGSAAVTLENRLYGPAGLDIGARGPAPIALSIIAQMQAELSRAS